MPLSDGRGQGTIVGLHYDHGVLLAATAGTAGACRIEPLYGHAALAARGDAAATRLLHTAGVHLPDIRAFSYRFGDIDARTLAFAYASGLMQTLLVEPRGFQVELLVADVGPAPDEPDGPPGRHLYQVEADGRVTEIGRYAAIGDEASRALEDLDDLVRRPLDLDEAALIALRVLRRAGGGAGRGEPVLAGVDDRRHRTRFYRIPPAAVERAGRLEEVSNR